MAGHFAIIQVLNNEEANCWLWEWEISIVERIKLKEESIELDEHTQQIMNFEGKTDGGDCLGLGDVPSLS